MKNLERVFYQIRVADKEEKLPRAHKTRLHNEYKILLGVLMVEKQLIN
jgi:hypothetical protein